MMAGIAPKGGIHREPRAEHHAVEGRSRQQDSLRRAPVASRTDSPDVADPFSSVMNGVLAEEHTRSQRKQGLRYAS